MIKKVTVFVDVNEEELLKDEYYKEEMESLIKEGQTESEAKADIVEHYLELELDFIFQGRDVINHHTYEIDNVKKADKYDSAYIELKDWLER